MDQALSQHGNDRLSFIPIPSLSSSSIRSIRSIRSFLILTSLFLLFVFNSLAEAGTFGTPGRDGARGRDGANGENGPDKVIVLSELDPQSFRSLDLSGVMGRDGDLGEPGEDATQCNFHWEPREDMHGASGGRGGDGGNGGKGGNGGNLTVYSINPYVLQNIYVDSLPGEGGLPGDGDRGGRGCWCPRSNWSVRECEQVRNPDGTHREECHYRHYSCYNGSDGGSGRRGKRGADGVMGSLTLIDREKRLPAEVPFLSPYLHQMNGSTYQLSQHKWIHYASGARTLLAPRSRIQDAYRVYERTLERQFQLVWQSERPIELFKRPVHLKITDKEVEASFDQDLWIDRDQKTEGSLTTVVIKNVVTKEEAENVHIGSVEGSGKNLKLEITDDAGVADIVKTTFRLTVERKQGFWYKTVYSGDVTEDMVTRDGNRFLIDVGSLKIPAQYLFRGKSVKMVVSIKRELGGKESSWRVSKKFKI